MAKAMDQGLLTGIARGRVRARMVRLAAGCLILVLGQTGGASAADPVRAEAHLRSMRQINQVGRPIYVDFTLVNPTDEPLTLRSSDAEETSGNDKVELMLPANHIFGGAPERALQVVMAANGAPVEWAGLCLFHKAVPAITIPPRGVIGARMDLVDCFPGLQATGTYYIQWFPYNGVIASERIKVTVEQLKQAVIDTNYGPMTLAFEYETAPLHVANFIELAQSRFYEGKTFHQVYQGMLVQGGCPRGDGTGTRADGKTLPGEFSDLPHTAGTVSMARKPSDPDSASCQFFICATRLKEFDGKYTVFARLIGQESFDTLQKIVQVQTDERDRPLKQVTIRSVRIENATYE